MIESVVGRGYDYVLEAEMTTREVFPVPLLQTAGNKVRINATLSYIFFVDPPAEAKTRMQKGIAARIEEAKTQEEKHEILYVEIPARMGAMHNRRSTFPDVLMASATKTLKVETVRQTKGSTVLGGKCTYRSIFRRVVSNHYFLRFQLY